MILRYIGYILVLNGLWMLFQRLTAHSRVMGTVVGHEKENPANSGDSTAATTPLFRAIIEFPDAQKPHRFTAPGGEVAPKPARGTRVSVRYRPGNPDDAYIETFAQMWVMPIAWLAIGVVAIYFSLR